MGHKSDRPRVGQRWSDWIIAGVIGAAVFVAMSGSRILNGLTSLLAEAAVRIYGH